MSESVKKSEEMRQAAIALLLEERGEIDEQLARLGFTGAKEAAPKKERVCGKCGEQGHTARNCTAEAKTDA